MDNMILFHTEECTFEKVKNKEGKEIVTVSGNAQPLNEDSRNGVRYRPESVKKASSSLSGVAFLFNHDASKSLGHVSKAGLTDSHLTYTADVDPEEKEYLRKVERGDIKHVSVGCMVENVAWLEDEEIYECDVKEYLELSAVTVPGFSNTSANKESALYIANTLGDKEVIAKLESIAKKGETAQEDSEDESPKEDEKGETAQTEEPAEVPQETEGSDDDDEDEEEESTDDEDEDEEEESTEDEEDDDDDEKENKDTETTETVKTESSDEEAPKDNESEESTEEVEEETPEEKIERIDTQNKEIFSKLETVENRLSSIESKIDAEESVDDETELIPAEEETFKNTHAEGQEMVNSKKNLEKKEKLLSKKKKKEEVNLNDSRLENLSY